MGIVDSLSHMISGPQKAKITLILYEEKAGARKKGYSKTEQTGKVKVLDSVTIGGASKNPSVGAPGANVTGGLAEGVGNLAGNALNAVAGDLINMTNEPGSVSNGPSGSKDGQSYTSKVFTVLFNPASLSITATAGGLRESKTFNTSQKGKSATGATESISYIMNSRKNMTFSVKLVFDKVVEHDAFSSIDPFSVSLTGSTVGSIASAFMGTSYSVQKEVEGFLAALQTGKRSSIIFEWGDLRYEGVFYSVDAEYVMFNPKGEPIRANVYLSMTIIDSDLGYGMDSDFSKAFNDVFNNKRTSWDTTKGVAGGLIQF